MLSAYQLLQRRGIAIISEVRGTDFSGLRQFLLNDLLKDTIPFNFHKHKSTDFK